MNRSNRGPVALAVLALMALALSQHPPRAALTYESSPSARGPAAKEIEIKAEKYGADPEVAAARQTERIKLALSQSDRGPLALAVFAAMALALSQQPHRADSVYRPSSRTRVETSVREIEVTAQKYEFDPETLTVKQNERVKLVITAVDHDHGFKIEAYHIDQLLKKGEQTTVEFTADTPGTFRFECSHLCGLGHKAMKGQLVVEPVSQRAPEEDSGPVAEQASNR